MVMLGLVINMLKYKLLAMQYGFSAPAELFPLAANGYQGLLFIILNALYFLFHNHHCSAGNLSRNNDEIQVIHL